MIMQSQKYAGIDLGGEKHETVTNERNVLLCTRSILYY